MKSSCFSLKYDRSYQSAHHICINLKGIVNDRLHLPHYCDTKRNIALIDRLNIMLNKVRVYNVCYVVITWVCQKKKPIELIYMAC